MRSLSPANLLNFSGENDCQGLTQGVRSSTRVVRLVEERLRLFSSMSQSGSTNPNGAGQQDQLSKKARDLKEGIFKGRAALQMLFAITRYSRTIFDFFKLGAKA